MSVATTDHQAAADAPPRTAKPIENFRAALDRMDSNFQAMLPAHIPVERFKRVVLTAVSRDMSLLEADRQSLFLSCTQAANDGLMPNAREGALVIFNTKVKRNGNDVWIKMVQWLPMAYGLIKKMRNSGEVVSIVAHPVYEKDHFEYVLGDEERIDHTPTMAVDRGAMVAVYAIASLKDGTRVREVMTKADVDKVRESSRSKDSPAWKNWYEQMARAKVLHRISKWLPMSSEVEAFVRRVELEEAIGTRLHSSATIDGDATHEADLSHRITASSKLDRFDASEASADNVPAAEDDGPEQTANSQPETQTETETATPDVDDLGFHPKTGEELGLTAKGMRETLRKFEDGKSLSAWWSSEDAAELLGALSSDEAALVKAEFKARRDALAAAKSA